MERNDLKNILDGVTLIGNFVTKTANRQSNINVMLIVLSIIIILLSISILVLLTFVHSNNVKKFNAAISINEELDQLTPDEVHRRLKTYLMKLASLDKVLLQLRTFSDDKDDK